MKSIPFVFMLVFCVAIWEFGSTNPVAMSCDSCGSECARACGTRHFRSCCFNYVRKRSSVSPYALNRLRYDLLYRQPGLGINEQKEKLLSKTDQEPKPRKDSPQSPNKLSSTIDVVDRENINQFYKPWKEDLPIEIVVVDDYTDEHRPASDGRQQLIFDA